MCELINTISLSKYCFLVEEATSKIKVQLGVGIGMLPVGWGLAGIIVALVVYKIKRR